MIKIPKTQKLVDPSTIIRPKSDYYERANKLSKTLVSQMQKINKENPNQRALEESLKDRDFTTFSKQQNAKKDDNVKISNAINALQVLKSNFNKILAEIVQYDPSNKTVQKIEEEIELLKKTFDNQIRTLLSILPNVGKLNERERKIMNVIDRDIERYSVDYNKIKGEFDSLTGKEDKKSIQEVENIKKRLVDEKTEKEIEKSVRRIIKKTNTPADDKIITEALNSGLNKIVYDELMNETDYDVSRLAKSLPDLEIGYNYININRRLIVDKAIRSSPFVKKLLADIRTIQNQAITFIQYVQNPIFNNIGDIKNFLNSDQIINSLVKEIEEIIKELNNIAYELGQNKATKHSIRSNFMTEENMKDDVSKRFKKLKDMLSKLKNNIFELDKLMFSDDVTIPTNYNIFTNYDKNDLSEDAFGRTIEYKYTNDAGNVKKGKIKQGQMNARAFGHAYIDFTYKQINEDVLSVMNDIMRYDDNIKKNMKSNPSAIVGLFENFNDEQQQIKNNGLPTMASIEANLIKSKLAVQLLKEVRERKYVMPPTLPQSTPQKTPPPPSPSPKRRAAARQKTTPKKKTPTKPQKFFGFF